MAVKAKKIHQEITQTKATLYDIKGKKKSEISLPKIFSLPIREDIVQKSLEIEKYIHPYAPSPEAGRRHSASGTISHKRHDWKGHYGRGISRVPRKTMWRRGTQFFWIGAEVSGTRGGRKAHPPKLAHTPKRINKKEIQIALNSALASTASKKHIINRYSTLKDISTMPAVIESLPGKTKELLIALKTIFKDAQHLLTKQKQTRPGKGKLRGRKYKANAGILILTGNKEKPTTKQLDIIPLKDIRIADLYPLGRLTLFTKQAIEELSKEETK